MFNCLDKHTSLIRNVFLICACACQQETVVGGISSEAKSNINWINNFSMFHNQKLLPSPMLSIIAHCKFCVHLFTYVILLINTDLMGLILLLLTTVQSHSSYHIIQLINNDVYHP